jgi:hypothetical protein
LWAGASRRASTVLVVHGARSPRTMLPAATNGAGRHFTGVRAPADPRNSLHRREKESESIGVDASCSQTAPRRAVCPSRQNRGGRQARAQSSDRHVLPATALTSKAPNRLRTNRGLKGPPARFCACDSGSSRGPMPEGSSHFRAPPVREVTGPVEMEQDQLDCCSALLHGRHISAELPSTMRTRTGRSR